MPYTYNRKTEDVSYRIVSVNVMGIKEFQPFTSPNETVSYPDVGCVLEVKKNNGDTALYYGGPIKPVVYIIAGTDTFKMAYMPLGRIWARRSDGTGIPYKVPDIQQDAHGQITIRIPGGVAAMELYGDKYSEMIYPLSRG